MAAPYSYLARSATVAGVALNGTVSFNVKQTGTPIDLSSDADIYRRHVAMSRVDEEIEVETLDVSAAIAVGASGSTTLVGAKHTGGVTLTGTLTCTATSGVVTGVDKTINQDGRPALRITLAVRSSDGATTGIGWASA